MRVMPAVWAYVALASLAAVCLPVAGEPGVAQSEGVADLGVEALLQGNDHQHLVKYVCFVQSISSLSILTANDVPRLCLQMSHRWRRMLNRKQ